MKNKKRLWAFVLGTFTAYSVFASTNYENNKLANTTINNATKKPHPAVAHHVGDCYGGGVIIYMNDETSSSAKQHGLIAALADIPKSFEWDTQASHQSTVKTRATLFTGSKNTSAIISTIGANRARAASATQHYSQGNYHDWHLPSKDELSMMYWQPMTHGGDKFWTTCGGTALSGATYWSSTQSKSLQAWGLSFAGGVVVVANKQSPLLVRAIRAF